MKFRFWIQYFTVHFGNMYGLGCLTTQRVRIWVYNWQMEIWRLAIVPFILMSKYKWLVIWLFRLAGIKRLMFQISCKQVLAWFTSVFCITILILTFIFVDNTSYMTQFCATIPTRLGTWATVRSATRGWCCGVWPLELPHHRPSSALLDSETEAGDGLPLRHSTESPRQHAAGRGGDHDRGRVASTCRPGLPLPPLLLPPLNQL